jgi:hypothetical protein
MRRALALAGKLGTLIVLLLLATASRADDVLFSNFGNSNSYDVLLGNAVGNAFDGNNYGEADTFTPSVTETFASLTIALSCLSVCPDSFSVSLDGSVDGAPGAVLTSFVVNSASLGPLGANNAPLVLNTSVGPILTADTQYWITVSSDLSDSIAWNLNSTGDTAAEAISSDGGATWFSPSGQTPGAFEVQGVQTVTEVPEPSSLLLAMTAIPLVILLARRGRKANSTYSLCASRVHSRTQSHHEALPLQVLSLSSSPPLATAASVCQSASLAF